MVDEVHIAIIGVGNLEVGPPLMATIAQYFGERPLAIRLYDPNHEIAELIGLLAKALFNVTDSVHILGVFEDYCEALAGAHGVIFCPDYPGEELWTKHHPDFPEKKGFADAVLSQANDAVSVINLTDDYDDMRMREWGPWPGFLEEDALDEMPHQILRWIHDDDSPHELLEANKISPFREWIEEICVNLASD